MYHLLGIEPETLIHDKLKRPYPVATGEPIYKLLGGRAPEPSPLPPLRLKPTQRGRFTNMLRERGLRYLTIDFGNPDSEADWKLTGFSEPIGTGLDRYRQPEQPTARITYQGIWHVLFDWAYLVLRCPRTTHTRRSDTQTGRQTATNSRRIKTTPPTTTLAHPLPGRHDRREQEFRSGVNGNGLAAHRFGAGGGSDFAAAFGVCLRDAFAIEQEVENASLSAEGKAMLKSALKGPKPGQPRG